MKDDRDIIDVTQEWKFGIHESDPLLVCSSPGTGIVMLHCDRTVQVRDLWEEGSRKHAYNLRIDLLPCKRHIAVVRELLAALEAMAEDDAKRKAAKRAAGEVEDNGAALRDADDLDRVRS